MRRGVVIAVAGVAVAAVLALVVADYVRARQVQPPAFAEVKATCSAMLVGGKVDEGDSEGGCWTGFDQGFQAALDAAEDGTPMTPDEMIAATEGFTHAQRMGFLYGAREATERVG